MPISGIEYFAAPDDDDALAFAEGNSRRDVSLLRADGIAPAGLLAALGALLTGRSMDDLSSPESLRLLSSEDRHDYTILLARLPDEITERLREADDDVLTDVARRSAVYRELAGVPADDIVAFLRALADVAGSEGALYTRMLAPREIPPPRRSVRSRGAAIAPWAGLVLAVLMAAASVVLIPLGVPITILALSGALAGLSIGAILRRRHTRRADAAAGVRGGLVLSWVADRPARALLAAAATAAIGEPDRHPRGRVPGRWGYLAVDPGGITVHAGSEPPLRFPRSVIADVTTVTVDAASGGFGLRAPTPGLAFELRSASGGTITWTAPLVSTTGTALHPAQVEGVRTEVIALLGSLTPR